MMAARREARRRRILENSQSRLDKITGKAESITLNECSSHVNDSHKSIQNGPVFSDVQHDNDNNRDHQHTMPSAYGFNFDNLFRQSNDIDNAEQDVSSKASQWPPWLQKFICMKFHFAMLAFVVRILYHNDFGFIFFENMLIPFVLTELLCYYLKFSPADTGDAVFDLAGVMLVLYGCSPRLVTLLKSIMLCVVCMIRDLCVYLSFFVICHIILGNYSVLIQETS